MSDSSSRRKRSLESKPATQWRSFEQLEHTDEFNERVEREFPEGASEFSNAVGAEGNADGFSRRAFLKTMAAPLAFAGLASCGVVRKPRRKIYPYVRPPEYLIPGKPLYFATTHTLGGEAVGLLVESHEGRPTKIEGNPLHEESGGKTRAFHQASVLDLYSPERLKQIQHGSMKIGSAGMRDWISELDLASTEGAGTGIFFPTQSSPTFYRMLRRVKERYPGIKTYRYDALSNDNALTGISQVTTTRTRALSRPDYARADVIVSLDSDFLGLELGSLVHQAAFAKRRNPDGGGMNRLYHYESSFTVTGSVADHRFRMKRQDIELIAYRLFYRFYEKGIKRISKPFIALLEDVFRQVGENFLKAPGYRAVSAMVDDLLEKSSRAVIVAGSEQSPLVHALVAYMNEFINAPLTYLASPFEGMLELAETNAEALKRFKNDLASGVVKNVINLGADPLYTAPADVSCVVEYKRANTLTLALYPNATTAESDVVVPQTHYLESWSDAVSLGGVLSVVQPLLMPLYAESLSPTGMLAELVDERDVDEAQLVRETHKFSDKVWRKTLHDGVAAKGSVRNTSRTLVVSSERLFAAVATGTFPLRKGVANELEVTFDPDYSVYDGTFYNNAWMQELPDPIMKLTWENVAVFSYTTARRYGVKSQDLITLKLGDVEVRTPVWVLPGQADDSIALKLGYGQRESVGVAHGSGYNVYGLRRSDSLGAASGASIAPTGESCKLASVQDHWAIADEIFTGGPSSNSQNARPLHRSTTLEDYKRHPDFAKAAIELPKLSPHHERVKGKTVEEVQALRTDKMSIFDEIPLTGEYQWGLNIDLGSCTGCNACVVACQAENNIPVVGKEMVIRGREMHWLRIDRYFEGNPLDAKMVRQPVICMQCEQAPCEQVCPVVATVHSREGLNDMVYNRCVGTRFCSNNCPYKVRRFNFLDYHGRSPHSQKRVSSHIFDIFREPAESLQMQFNPDVTVRMRGVMEKCTYCVQRINAVRTEAHNQGRKIEDGEIVTACEQACPSSSIVFGNIADKRSRVSRRKKYNRDYVMLEELNVKPRTSYTAAVTNPNLLLRDG